MQKNLIETKELIIEEKILIARSPLPAINVIKPIYTNAGTTPYVRQNIELDD